MKKIVKCKIVKCISRAAFDFSFPYNILALITNPFFFVRRNLYKNVKLHSSYLNGKLLDFGCGCKPYKSLLVDVREYIGLDIDDRGLDHTNSVIDVYYDGETIPFEDEYFDSMFSTEVYEHVPNLARIVPEMNRVLKIGGVMLVTAPLVWNEHGVPWDFQRFTKYGLINLLEKNGFEIIKTNTATSYVEMIFQMWMEYLRRSFEKICSKGLFTLFIQVLLIFPAALIGCIVSFILPKDDSLYGDTVVICRKVRNKKWD